MTITSEQDYKNEIVQYLEFYGLDVQRHEDKYETGIPDLSYGGHGVNGWIEVKWEIIKFRTKQPLWLSKRAMTGGHTFVLIGYRGAAKLIDWRKLTLTVYKGEISDYVESLIDRLCLAECWGTETAPHRQLEPGFHRQLEKYLHPE